MTVTEKDLFLAILAMDSYNRGYDAGIKDGGDNDPDGIGEFGSQIGNASVMAVALPQGAQAAGFYAVAYQTQYGTVISYRGTDFTPAADFATDRDQGWTLGGGNVFAVEAKRGVDFLAAVQPDTAPDRPFLPAHH
ncbi:MAG: hypothetical protein EAZ40_13925 [Rhodobacterales bacterium]|nr:MAG: hypothetical protein EAZ40_13925 [Rhodobacterales bacterium]